MCPLCDKRCTYWFLAESCNYSRATYLFDNPATVAFACFMALWGKYFTLMIVFKGQRIGLEII